jgi:hypothetical protein
VLFRLLDHQTILCLYCACVTEQKIVLCSARWSVLTHVAECLCALLFPFSWQGAACVYVAYLSFWLCPYFCPCSALHCAALHRCVHASAAREFVRLSVQSRAVHRRHSRLIPRQHRTAAGGTLPSAAALP